MSKKAISNTFNKKLYTPMILGSILNPINSSMLAVALIPIAQAFGVPFIKLLGLCRLYIWLQVLDNR